MFHRIADRDALDRAFRQDLGAVARQAQDLAFQRRAGGGAHAHAVAQARPPGQAHRHQPGAAGFADAPEMADRFQFSPDRPEGCRKRASGFSLTAFAGLTNDYAF
jgi:hypothetical protein